MRVARPRRRQRAWRRSAPRISSGGDFSGRVPVVFNIYVGNIAFDTSESDIHELFSQHGEVERVNLITDRETGRPRGFGFVEMQDDNAGRTAIEAINGAEFGGRQLKVNEAKPRAARPAGGGGGGGGDGGRERW